MKIAFFVALITVAALDVAWKRFEYLECLRVGHSKLYCVFRVGK